MMNRNDKLEIAKRLRLSTESEMSRDDLEKLLEEELTKPEAEMDAELVQMILEVLEDGPSTEQTHKSWQEIDGKLSSRRQWLPAVNGLTRIAAVGVLIVAIMFATYGTAQAFNWEFLLRLMKPFAETFMLYSGGSPEVTPAPESSEVYTDELVEITQSEFMSLADCPDEIAGYPVKPDWMPERFTFVQGSIFDDMHVQAISLLFSSDAGICLIDISVFAADNEVDSYNFEQQPDENSGRYIAGYPVTFYHNTDEPTLSASWIVENVHYWITGAMTEDEIACILESMMKSGEVK